MPRAARHLAVLAGLLLFALAPARAADPDNTIYLDVPAGRVVIELLPNLAPMTVAHVKELTRRGFYDGLSFHRVIERGTLGLARSSDPDSGDSQFFICFKPAPFLDGKYTIFGKVTSGMEYIDAIKKGDPDRNGSVDNPDHIVRMQIAADADKAKKS
jgi:peptidylprolyl isomerase